MNTIHCTGKEPLVRQIANAAFPNYNGRTFKIEVSDAPINCASYWDGGSRDYFSFVCLSTMKASAEVPAQSAFDLPISGVDAVVMPEGIVCVRHSIFCGQDSGITIIIRPENAAGLLPAPVTLTWAESVVLYATSSLKSSYAGISNYRFVEAERETRISQKEWNEAKASLIERGLLNKAGAITPEGRNARASWSWPAKKAIPQGAEPYRTKYGAEQYRPRMAQAEFSRMVEDNEGFCLACASGRPNTEPDGAKLTCDSCGAPKVYGMETLLLMGLARIIEHVA